MTENEIFRSIVKDVLQEAIKKPNENTKNEILRFISNPETPNIEMVRINIVPAPLFFNDILTVELKIKMSDTPYPNERTILPESENTPRYIDIYGYRHTKQQELDIQYYNAVHYHNESQKKIITIKYNDKELVKMFKLAQLSVGIVKAQNKHNKEFKNIQIYKDAVKNTKL